MIINGHHRYINNIMLNPNSNNKIMKVPSIKNHLSDTSNPKRNSNSQTSTSEYEASSNENNYFATTSFFCLTNENKVRYFIQTIVVSKYFYNWVNIIIVLNCLFLIFETIPSFYKISSMSSTVFTIWFVIEFLLKITAYGFIFDSNSYLHDPWNWLDFIVIITGLVSFLPEISANLLALRTFRWIRPLKTISMLPNMRIFISTLINSIFDLGTVFLVLIFFMTIFGIFGLSWFKERFEYWCRNTIIVEQGFLDVNPWYGNRLCGGENTCGGDMAKCWSSREIMRENVYFVFEESYRNELKTKNLNYGWTNFNNFLNSWFVVFMTTTVEGWSKVMFMLMDGYNYYIAFWYFFLLIIVNYFFLWNLIVAIWWYNFNKAKMWELVVTISIKKEKTSRYYKLIKRWAKWNKKKIADYNNWDEAQKANFIPNFWNFAAYGNKNKDINDIKDNNSANNTNLNSPKVETQPEKKKDSRNYSQLSKFRNINVKLDNVNTQNLTEEAEMRKMRRKYFAINDWCFTVKRKKDGFFTINSLFSLIYKIKWFSKVRPETQYQRTNKYGFICFLVYKQPIVQTFFYICIILNNVILALDHHGMKNDDKKLLETINIIIVSIFTFEITWQISASGVKDFFSDWLNCWDFFIVFMSWIEISWRESNVLTQPSWTSIANIFLIFRILRLFKWFREWESFHLVVESIQRTIIRMTDFLFIFLLFWFIYALLGFSFFNNTLKFKNDLYETSAESNHYNFDNFINSLTCVFIIIIGDHWTDWFIDCFRSPKNQAWKVILYYITLVLFGQITLVNIFLAYLIDNFQTARNQWQSNSAVKSFMESLMYQCIDKNWNWKSSKKKSKTIEEWLKNYKKLWKKGKSDDLYIISEGVFEIKNTKKITFAGKKEENIDCSNPKTEKDYWKTLKKKNAKHIVDFHGNWKVINFQTIVIKNSTNDQYEKFFSSEVETANFYGYSCNYYCKPNEKVKNNFHNFDENDNLQNIDGNDGEYYDTSVWEENIELKSVTSSESSNYFLNPNFKGNKKNTIFNMKETNLLSRKIAKVNCFQSNSYFNNHSISSKQSSLRKNSWWSASSLHSNSQLLDTVVNSNLPSILRIKRENLCASHKYLPPVKYDDKWPPIVDEGDFEEFVSINTKNNLIQRSTSNEELTPEEKSNTRTESRININDNNNNKKTSSKSLMIMNSFTIQRKETMKSVINYTKKHKNFWLTPREYHDSSGSSDSDEENYYKNKSKYFVMFHKTVKYIRKSSWLFIGKNWKFRRIIHDFVNRPVVSYVIFGLIITNTLLLCLDHPWVNPNTTFYKLMDIANKVYTSCFCFTTSWKIISDGFFFNKYAYLRNPINVVDFTCLIIGILGLAGLGREFRYLRTFRSLRSVKPIRWIIKSDNLSLMIETLWRSIPSMANLWIVSWLFIFLFAILAVNWFKTETLFYCNINESIQYEEECHRWGGYWVKASENFSNIIEAWKSNFEWMLTDAWTEMMQFVSVKTTKLSYLYFIIYIIIGNLFILNLIVAILIQQFQSLKSKKNQYVAITDPERQWIHIQKIMMKFHPEKNAFNNTNNCFHDKWYKIFESIYFDITISVIIIFQGLTLIFQHSGASYVYNSVIEITNYICGACFNIELIWKLYTYKRSFFYNSWNWFDFTIIILNDIMLILRWITFRTIIETTFVSLPFVLRWFRWWRVLRLISNYGKMRALIDTLLYWLPSIGNVGVMIAYLFLIYGNIGMNIFGTVPYRKHINQNNNFHNFFSSCILWFVATTGEDWNKVMNEAAYHDCRDPTSMEYQRDSYCVDYNITCYDDEYVNYTSMNDFNMFSCGNDISYLYFITFVLICPVFIMNLCVVMVIEGFSESMYENEGLWTRDYMENFIKWWMEYDEDSDKIIRPYEFILILKELQPPLGFNYDRYILQKFTGKQKNDITRYKEYKRWSICETLTKNGDNLSQMQHKKTGWKKNEMYLSKDKKFFTTDIEIMQIVNRWSILSYNKNNAVKKVGFLRLKKSLPNVDMRTKLDNKELKTKPISTATTIDLNVHFIDACFALSKYAVSMIENVSSLKLRRTEVSKYTKKMWRNEYSKEELIPFFTNVEEREKCNQLAQIIGAKTLFTFYTNSKVSTYFNYWKTRPQRYVKRSIASFQNTWIKNPHTLIRQRKHFQTIARNIIESDLMSNIKKQPEKRKSVEFKKSATLPFNANRRVKRLCTINNVNLRFQPRKITTINQCSNHWFDKDIRNSETFDKNSVEEKAENSQESKSESE